MAAGLGRTARGGEQCGGRLATRIRSTTVLPVEILEMLEMLVMLVIQASTWTRQKFGR